MQKLPIGQRILLAFTAFYILAFGLYYLREANLEFIGYLCVLVASFALVYYTLPRTQFTTHILWGLSLWGLLHMAGGSIRVGDDVLYAFKIVELYNGGGEFYVLRMDQVIHALGFGVTALAMHHLLERFAFRSNAPRFWLAVVAINVAMGLGAVNEIIEFIAVVVVQDNGVGGYYNTALDLVFNGLGATLAVVIREMWLARKN